MRAYRVITQCHPASKDYNAQTILPKYQFRERQTTALSTLDMATFDMNSTSQVVAILAQIYHTTDRQDWFQYITLLDEILEDNQESSISLQSLTDWLQQKPLLQLIHGMLWEEFTEGGNRTLPTALPNMYPWAATPVDIIDAFINFAQQREELIGQPTDGGSASPQAIQVLVAELGVPGVTSFTVEQPTDELTDQFSGLQVAHAVDVGSAVHTPDQYLDELMDSMQLN
jgi:hypothetical protein